MDSNPSTPHSSTRLSASQPSSPASPGTPGRRSLFGTTDNPNDATPNDQDSVVDEDAASQEHERVPATPIHQQNARESPPQSPSVPLSPLIGLDDDNEDDVPSNVQPNNANPNDDGDDGSEAEVPQQHPAHPNNGADEQDYFDQPNVLITARGTDVNVRQAAATFRDFLRTFRSLRNSAAANSPSRSNGGNNDNDSSDDSDDDSLLGMNNANNDRTDQHLPPLYLTKLESILGQTTTTSLDIDTMHLFYHNQDCQRLYHQIVHFPMELIPLMDLVVQREATRLMQDMEELRDRPPPMIQVRPYNLKDVSNLRCLDPIALDSLVCLKGMIVRTSPVIPDLKVAHFSCVICGNDQQVAIDRGRLEEPRQCPTCNTKKTYQIIHNRSLFSDKQLVRLQETPDQVPAGQTPASVVTFCFDNLVDTCQPGDKVEVTGVLRAQPVRINPKISKVKSIYKTYVDVIHFKTTTGMGRSGNVPAPDHDATVTTTAPVAQHTTSKLSPQRIQELKRLASQPDIYEQLTRSLAPSIWELDNVKKGVLCMLFGGNHCRVKNNRRRHVNADNDNSNNNNMEEDEEEEGDTVEGNDDTKLNKRGDINILLCGDPGTSKSQLLSYVHKLSSRGIYTSGKGSSAVGLTASVARDPETKDLVLESGALVLSDRGICCIDEFDKMSDATRSILHEAMEQQTVSIAKAGIIATLNARTSILASANPLESRYNPNLSVVENIKLPPTLLSRFDLIYLILDSPNPDQDRKLAQHLVGLYYETPAVVEPPMDTNLLRDYIDYAREHIHPSLSDEATQQLLESYLELRNPPGGNVGNNGTRTISATPRQLESLVRTSEALAKMRYSNVVTRADAQEAVRLLKVATQAAATDPRTGKIDMDMINTGRSTVDRENGEHLYNGVKDFLFTRRGKRLAIRDVVRQMAEVTNQPIPHDDMVDALRRMESDGIIQFNERNQSIFVRSGIMA